jgi:hypothetical protein
VICHWHRIAASPAGESERCNARIVLRAAREGRDVHPSGGQIAVCRKRLKAYDCARRINAHQTRNNVVARDKPSRICSDDNSFVIAVVPLTRMISLRSACMLSVSSAWAGQISSGAFRVLVGALNYRGATKARYNPQDGFELACQSSSCRCNRERGRANETSIQRNPHSLIRSFRAPIRVRFHR